MSRYSVVKEVNVSSYSLCSLLATVLDLPPAHLIRRGARTQRLPHPGVADL